MTKFDTDRLLEAGDLSNLGTLILDAKVVLGVAPQEGKFAIEAYQIIDLEDNSGAIECLEVGYQTYTAALEELIRIVNFL